MATNFNEPTNTTTYTNVWEYVRDNIEQIAKMFQDGLGTNIPTDTIRFNPNAGGKRLEKWNGTTWVELLPEATSSEAYNMRVLTANTADRATDADSADACDGDCTGNSVTATTATNLLVGATGHGGADFHLLSTLLPATSGGTGASSPTGYWSIIGVPAKTDLDTRYCLESNNLSDLTSNSAARSNLSVYSTLDVYTKTETATNFDRSIGQFSYSSVAIRTVTLGYQPATVILWGISPANSAIVFTPTITSTGFTFISMNTDITYFYTAVR